MPHAVVLKNINIRTRKMDKFIFEGPKKDVYIHEKGLGWRVFELLHKHKGKIMQICTETGVHEKYEQVLSRAIRTALELKNRGITSNDVISICSINHLNSVVPFIASLFLNCKIACLDPSISEEDTKYLVDQVQPKVIFIGQEAEELITKVKSQVSFKFDVVSFGNCTNYERFVNFLKPNPDEETFKPELPSSLKDTIIIFFSSGTTGLPKGICLSHYGLLKQQTMDPISPEFTELIARVMSFASHYWISTFNMFYIAIQAGTTRIIVPKFDVKKVWEAIDIFKPTFIFGAPCQILDLLQEGDIPEGKNADSVRGFAIGGTPTTPDQLDFLRSKFNKSLVLTGYGQTESAGNLSFPDMSTPEALKKTMEKKTSCGMIVPNIKYKVVDVDTGDLCPLNQKGELYVKSDAFMNGYYNMDSSSAWDEDGWLKTGDIVYIDDDMFIHIVDRNKEMLKYKSWHVVPAKLEAVVSKHPDVINIVAFGVPHELDGDHPAVAVTLKKGATVTAEELQKFADEQLDERQKLRGGVTILNEIPKTPTGKYSRRKVRDYVLQLKK